jgi:hypothetical protein
VCARARRARELRAQLEGRRKARLGRLAGSVAGGGGGGGGGSGGDAFVVRNPLRSKKGPRKG